MVSAVLFDIDGTLLDSVDLHAAAWHEAFAHFGVVVELPQIRSQIGKGGDKLVVDVLGKEKAAALGEELEAFRKRLWMEQYIERTRPFPAVRELFLRCREQGLRVALASSAKEEELAFYKKRLGVEDLLDTSTSSDDVARSKPDPDIFATALQQLGNPPPATSWVVGDSPYDAEAANKLGVPAIAFRSGGFPDDWLRRSGYRVLYQGAADLLLRFEESPLAR